MIPLTLRQLRHAVGGKALNVINDDAPPITAVSTSSKELEKGSLFIALKGEKFDGHDFVKEAVENGAAALLVSREPKDAPSNIPRIGVSDTRTALGRLAKH